MNQKSEDRLIAAALIVAAILGICGIVSKLRRHAAAQFHPTETEMEIFKAGVVAGATEALTHQGISADQIVSNSVDDWMKYLSERTTP